MKKVLFATTALVLSAGVAAAEVSLSGDGRMGVQYNGDDWNFSSRARVQFGLSGQTDNGLEFGGSFRVHEGNAARYGSSGTVFISGAFGQIELGDVVGAPEALFGDLPEVGFEDLTTAGGFENDIGYLTGDDGSNGLTHNFNPTLLYTYSSGPISLAASMTDGNSIDSENAYGTSVDDDQAYAIAAAYTFENYTIGAGYEILDVQYVPAKAAVQPVPGNAGSAATPAIAGGKQAQGTLAGTATFGNTDLKAYYAWGNQGNNLDNGYGIGFSSAFGATTVLGYVQKAEFVDGDDVTWWGLGATYDLGGGASLAGGLSDDDLDGSDVTADFGVKFKF